MQEDQPVYFALLWTLIANALALYTGYYKVEKAELRPFIRLSLVPVLACFAFYLICAIAIAPLLLKPLLALLQKLLPSFASAIFVTSLIQMMALSFILAISLLYLYSYNRETVKKIWKNSFDKSAKYDFFLGASTWLISFPLVVVISHFLDHFITWIFGPHPYEQTAVHFVKKAANAPLALIFALISVIIIAPIIEELLFRGLLQTYLKKHMHVKFAIAVSAIVFALFHLTASQGTGNIPLSVSLFVLGGFLGFLYEKQASLFASIGLHMTFNTISALRIIISPE